METNANLDAIQKKLRKLQKLYDGAKAINSEGEAEAAAAAIQRILTQYNITMAEVGEEITKDTVIEETYKYEYSGKTHGGNWEQRLVYVICKHNFCKCFGHGKGRMLVVGAKENMEMVEWLRKLLSERFLEMSLKRWEEYQETLEFFLKPCTRHHFMRHYLVGAILGLDKKLTDERNKDKRDEELGAKVTALIVRNDAAIDSYIAAKYKIRQGRGYKTTMDSATGMGIKDGRETQLYKPIADNAHAKVRSTALLG